MKSDKQGCSTCPIGEEQFEEFNLTDGVSRKILGQKRVQYDYRHTNGKLFSGIFINIRQARTMKDQWIKENNFA